MCTRTTKRCYGVKAGKPSQEGNEQFLETFLLIFIFINTDLHHYLHFSCDKVAWIDERNYWTFEGVLLVVGALSTGVTILRKRSLDRKVMLKVQRQLEQSV